MSVFAMVVFASVGLFALVFVGRAVSGARFNRALRAYALPADRRPFVESVPQASSGRRSA